MLSRLVACFCIGICLFAWALPVGAEPAGSMAQVKIVLDKAMEIQTRADLAGGAHLKERADLIRKLIGENFLSSEMAKNSLRENWDKLSAKQRSEFQDLFTGLFQESYTRMVLNFLQKETIEYSGESPEGSSMKVRTLIMRSNEHIPVDYLLDQKNGRWMIRDVIIDNVSIVDNYHTKFRQVIQADSAEGLIKRMRLQHKAAVDYIP